MQIREVIQVQGIRIYQPPIEPDDEMGAEHARILSEAIPFSIIGSTEDVTTADGRVVKGREYLWGVAEGEWGYPCSLRNLLTARICSRKREPLRFPKAAVATNPHSHAGPDLDDGGSTLRELPAGADGDAQVWGAEAAQV